METLIKKSNSVVLTENHIKTIEMFSNGKTAVEIARKIKKSSRTVEGYVLDLRDKYKCKNVTHLIATFLRLGIIK